MDVTELHANVFVSSPLEEFSKVGVWNAISEEDLTGTDRGEMILHLSVI